MHIPLLTATLALQLELGITVQMHLPLLTAKLTLQLEPENNVQMHLPLLTATLALQLEPEINVQMHLPSLTATLALQLEPEIEEVDNANYVVAADPVIQHADKPNELHNNGRVNHLVQELDNLSDDLHNRVIDHQDSN